MVNILGPHGAGINESTTRPEDTASGNPADTWFSPCIDGDPNTGTKIPSVWLNKVKATIVNAIRGVGIAQVETDDDMLLKCFQKIDRAIRNIGSAGVGIYKARHEDGTHEFYKLAGIGGISVQIDAPSQTVTVDGSGIAGVGGSPITLDNVGTGAVVYKGINSGTSVREFNRVRGTGGIAATNDVNGIVISAPGIVSDRPLDNIGDGADVYAGLAAGMHTLRGIKGVGGTSAVVVGDNIEISATNSWTPIAVAAGSLPPMFGLSGYYVSAAFDARGRSIVWHVDDPSDWNWYMSPDNGTSWYIIGSFLNGSTGLRFSRIAFDVSPTGVAYLQGNSGIVPFSANTGTWKIARQGGGIGALDGGLLIR